AGSVWAGVIEEHRGVLNQSCLDLHLAQTVDITVLDALGLALVQARAAVLQLDTIAAGIGQEEVPVAVADARMLAGNHPPGIGNDPVATVGATNDTAGLLEALAGDQAGHLLRCTDHIEYQFHGSTPGATVVVRPRWGHPAGDSRRR